MIRRLALLILMTPCCAWSLPLDVPDAGEQPVLDGRLDEAVWESALPVDLAWETSPGENLPAATGAICLVYHDREHLYVGFRCIEPEPAGLVARMADRDLGGEDDLVGLLVDPFHDRRRGFRFEVTAGGVQLDARRDEVGDTPDDYDWDAIWSSAVAREADGWSVEIAISFRALRFPNHGEPKTWGFLPYRQRPRSEREVTAALPLNRGDPCALCQVLELRGFAAVSTGHDLELTPTWTAARTDRSDAWPPGDLESGKVMAEPGLSLRWGPWTDVGLAAAINPDFSQVEADELQLEINTRYALYYREKRPFFLDGADLFDTPLEVVHTRTVVDPVWGAKASAKQGAWAVGVFGARDRAANLLLATNESSGIVPLGRDATTGVVRLRRDVGDGSTVGVLFTGREGDGYSNVVGGLDGMHRLSDADRVTWQALRSRTDGVTDEAGLVSYRHDGRDWSWSLDAERVDAVFRADAGFLARADYRNVESGLWRTWWRRGGSWFNQFGLGAMWGYGEDGGGRVSERKATAELYYQGPLRSRVWFIAGRESYRFAGRLWDLDTWRLKVGAAHGGVLTWYVSALGGDAIDTRHARPGRVLRLGPGCSYTPGERFEFSLDLLREDFDVGGANLYTADLAAFTLRYHLGPRTFVRAVLQFTGFDFEPASYTAPVDPEYDERLVQLLLSHKVNARTVLFLGTVENALGGSAFDTAATDRTWFFKLGYAWQP
jgi:hypothetical protein